MRPATDPQNSIHTLGRLAMATRSKGIMGRASQEMLGRLFSIHSPAGYSYTPTWAEDVAAIGFFDQTYSQRKLIGLTLEYRKTILSVVQGRHQNDPTQALGSLLNVQIVGLPGFNSYEEPLELGTHLQEQREAITNAATAFFRNAAR